MAESDSNVQKMSKEISAPETRIFLPDILEIILSHLGKHDLLMSRLVSSSWNEDALKVLRKSKFTQTLSKERMRNIITGTVNGICPFQFLLPFHLNLNVDAQDSIYYVGFIPVASDLKSLFGIFGPECVSGLTLTTEYHCLHFLCLQEHGLLEFLTFISTGLKSLDLTGFTVTVDGNLDPAVLGSLSFLNLRILICNTRKCESGTQGLGPFYSFIIENSPGLEHLELTDPCDMNSWPLRFETLKSLSLDTILNPEYILDKMHSCPSRPVLRHLSWKHHVGVAPTVYNILELISATLKSLRVKQKPHRSKVPTLPTLPRLTHIGFEYSAFVYVKPQHINFKPETLPSLTSVDLPIGFFIPEEVWGGVEFPNVDELWMRVSWCTFEPNRFGFKSIKRSLAQLQIMFPNPMKISITNGLRRGLSDNDSIGVKYLLDQIIQSDWSKNIREIEMNGFHEDFLGEVLDRLEFPPQVDLINWEELLENSIKKLHDGLRKMETHFVEDTSGAVMTTSQRPRPTMSHKMKNIISVTLNLICNRPRDEYTSDWSTPRRIPPNFTTFAKHFPLLQKIQISELLFREWNDKNVKKINLQFTSIFPNVTVNII